MNMTARMAVIALAIVTLACDTTRRDENQMSRDTTQMNDTTMGTLGGDSGHVDYVEKSMASGMLEVELGKLAQERASSPEVKRFAEMMVRDHTNAGEQLRQVAQRHSIQATAQLDQEHRDLIQRLSGLRGAEFDREYMNAMVERHEDVVDHLQSRADLAGNNRDATTGTAGTQAQDATAQSISQWAAKTLPTTEHHLDEARRIQDRLGNRTTQGQGNRY